MQIIGKFAAAAILAGSFIGQGAFAQSDDAQISKEAQALVSQSPALQADNISVHVADGVAYVHGVVSTELERAEALSLVARIKGITRVVDVTSVDNV